MIFSNNSLKAHAVTHVCDGKDWLFLLFIKGCCCLGVSYWLCGPEGKALQVKFWSWMTSFPAVIAAKLKDTTVQYTCPENLSLLQGLRTELQLPKNVD